MISNGVINLSPRKDRVFAEAARVLRPGGRLAISDIVSGRALKERTRRNVELWAACIAGAIPRDSYLEAIAAHGLGSGDTEERLPLHLRAGARRLQHLRGREHLAARRRPERNSDGAPGTNAVPRLPGGGAPGTARGVPLPRLPARGHRRGEPDFLAVVDAEDGRIVHETPMPNVGDELHHFGWNRCSSACHGPDRSHLIVPGFRSSRIHIVNVADDPRRRGSRR